MSLSNFLKYSNTQRDIGILITLKFAFSIVAYFVIVILLDQNIFLYPDFTNTYSDCSQNHTNIFYTRLLCGASFISGKTITPESMSMIIFAAMINIFVVAYYYKSLHCYLSRNGQLILIIMLAFHPYMAVYFFRFYTQIFAVLGILLIFDYANKQKQINLLFLVLAFVLMNFRNALIPVFFCCGIYEIVTLFYRDKKLGISPFVLMILCLISYIPAMSFSVKFADMASDFNIMSNLVYTFGFRESVALSGISSLLKQEMGYVQILISLIWLTGQI